VTASRWYCIAPSVLWFRIDFACPLSVVRPVTFRHPMCYFPGGRVMTDYAAFIMVHTAACSCNAYTEHEVMIIFFLYSGWSNKKPDFLRCCRYHSAPYAGHYIRAHLCYTMSSVTLWSCDLQIFRDRHAYNFLCSWIFDHPGSLHIRIVQQHYAAFYVSFNFWKTNLYIFCSFWFENFYNNLLLSK